MKYNLASTHISL